MNTTFDRLFALENFGIKLGLEFFSANGRQGIREMAELGPGAPEADAQMQRRRDRAGSAALVKHLHDSHAPPAREV